VPFELSPPSASISFIELPWRDILDEYDGDDLSLDFEGLVTVDQDKDRAYYEHEVDVRATLTGVLERALLENDGRLL
jgi:hypothetical protein